MVSRRRRARLTVALLVVIATIVTVVVVSVCFPTVTTALSPADPPLLSPSSGATTGGSGPGSSGASTGTASGGRKAGSLGSFSIVVDKKRPLSPLDYVPSDLVPVKVPFIGEAPVLRQAAATQVEALFSAFANETGQRMQSTSAYRSYDDQVAEYKKFSAQLGASGAEETTARPGYSEHQTGLAIDIGAKGSSCQSRDCFADTTQAKWLQLNAWRFGFIIRYPRGQQDVTGYTYEPWHIRFVGTALALKIHGHFSSLEAYFHLPAAPAY